ncbi:TPA: hypothetical protein N0F65_007900 [Lagenidium giganteum]|uniref:UspA domain-containing protein n=1 Tax=Lagenidium giganteum TaxID=4803 RepID=A0AAV2Z1T3_9STRA|nr:TPA: hypothetical protein N0F65_007900 [Lagenidium giganteum]
MKNVFFLKKPSPALQLCLQLTRMLLEINQSELQDDEFRTLVLDHSEEILQRVRGLTPEQVSDFAYERLCQIMEDAAYDPSLAARESESGMFIDMDALLQVLRKTLESNHHERRRLLPTTSFLIGVDGSRQSYTTFELTTRLRRQGKLVVLNVNEDQQSSIQMPLISARFIVDEYKLHCSRLRLPTNAVVIDSQRPDRSDEDPAADSISIIAQQLLRGCEEIYCTDFLVVGSVGKGGPAVDQVGHLPRELLSRTKTPVIIVPPAPVNSMSYKSSLFIVAVDRSRVAWSCLAAALKLMKPSDRLRIVHFYHKPLVGTYDFPYATDYEGFLESFPNMAGELDMLPMEHGFTLVECFQEYIAYYNVSYVIMGLFGEQTTASNNQASAKDPLIPSNPIGRLANAMLFSPRCALVLCPP